MTDQVGNVNEDLSVTVGVHTSRTCKLRRWWTKRARPLGNEKLPDDHPRLRATRDLAGCRQALRPADQAYHPVDRGVAHILRDARNIRKVA